MPHKAGKMSEKKSKAIERKRGRAADALRKVQWKKNIAPAATGSVLIKMGKTEVICAVSCEEKVPPWMKRQNVEGGWITAEYSMLPYASAERMRREATAGKVSGRTQEIQRLIGRSLRAVVNLEALGARTLWVDCDVIRADGGTRTAAITGAMGALRLAVKKLMGSGLLDKNPIQEPLAAVSVGIVDKTHLLDLCYEEDVKAEVDMNVVMTASGKFVELQGTAEGAPFSGTSMRKLTGLAEKGIRELLDLQNQTVDTKA